jgi:hypothetical protein
MGFYHFFAKVCDLECAKRIDPLIRIARSCGWVWMFAGAAIITDRPRLLRRDDQNRLHCEDGPALEYRDGFAIHAWHGTSIPCEWIEDKASLSAKTALTWANIEQRRAALEIVGWHNVLRELKAKVVDEHPDPLCGALVEVQLPDLDRKSRFIHARCGTNREFAIGVPPEMKTVVEAQAWLTGLPVSDFQFPTVRT